MKTSTYVFLIVAFVVVMFPVAVAMVQWCWNGFFPEVFGFKEITYTQAIKLFALGLLLTSSGYRGSR